MKDTKFNLYFREDEDDSWAYLTSRRNIQLMVAELERQKMDDYCHDEFFYYKIEEVKEVE